MTNIYSMNESRVIDIITDPYYKKLLEFYARDGEYSDYDRNMENAAFKVHFIENMCEDDLVEFIDKGQVKIKSPISVEYKNGTYSEYHVTIYDIHYRYNDNGDFSLVNFAKVCLIDIRNKGCRVGLNIFNKDMYKRAISQGFVAPTELDMLIQSGDEYEIKYLASLFSLVVNRYPKDVSFDAILYVISNLSDKAFRDIHNDRGRCLDKAVSNVFDEGFIMNNVLELNKAYELK